MYSYESGSVFLWYWRVDYILNYCSKTKEAKMKQAMKENIYLLFEELLKAIKLGAPDALLAYGINLAIYEEITEELARSGENVGGLRIPPCDIAFQADGTGRIPFDIVESNSDKEVGRVYCQLWNATGKSELTLIADVNQETDGVVVIFRLLETQ